MTSAGRVPRRSPARRALPLAAALALGVATLAGCSSATSSAGPAATAVVSRATLTAGVTATGALAASASENLGFPSGGQLTALDVKVGDKVTAGQTLATIDDSTLRQLLKQQQANVTQQQALLAKLQDSPAVSGAQSTLDQARQIASAAQGQVDATAQADQVAIDRAQVAQQTAQDARDSAEEALENAQNACTAPPCAAVTQAEAALASAKQGLETAKTAVATTKQKANVDAAAGKTSVQTANQSVVTAQNNLNSAASDRPHAIAQQQAAVASAQALVEVAKSNLAKATLVAPFDGTVTAINGAVGEYLTASTGTSALAPGSDAAIPGTTTQGNSSVARPGGSQFMVLARSGALSAVVPFTELDAAAIVPGQTVDAVFDALPDLTVRGTVQAVAPAGTALSGAMSYNATIQLDGTDERLKEGLSVRTTVHTIERADVLSVPTSAVHISDGQSSVMVVDASGASHSVTFEPGVVTADRTEVLSGLNEGDTVLTSTAVH